MNLLTICLLMIITGHSTSEYAQRLTCHYESVKNVTDMRIWCKRDVKDEHCCTGFAFRPGVTLLDDGKIKVEDDGKAFVVSVSTLTQGDGVYWCGLMDKDRKSIVKLSEDYFYTPLIFIWSVLRWIMFLLLALIFISTSIHINRTYGFKEKKYDDIKMQVKE